MALFTGIIRMTALFVLSASITTVSAQTPASTPGQPVPPPAPQYKGVTLSRIFEATVPTNWMPLSSDNSLKVAPQNGYGQFNGQTVFSHGVEFGTAKVSAKDLGAATTEHLKSLLQSNPELRRDGSHKPIRISQRAALNTQLVRPSPLGGNQRIGLYTALLADGTLFYFMTVIPEKEALAYETTFEKIGGSIRLIDTR